MPHRILKTQVDAEKFSALLGTLKLPVTVTWKQGEDRSHAQNRLQWKWAKEAADQRGDMTPAEIQAEWKLRHGIPILCVDDPEYLKRTERRFAGMNYEERLDHVQDLEVSRRMKVPQMMKYLDTIQRECLQQGIRLTDPDPMMWQRKECRDDQGT